MRIVDRALVQLLPAVPRQVVRRLSERYIAGHDLPDAVAVVRALNERGKAATLDVLGEESRDRGEAAALVAAYVQALAAIDRERLDATVSVKPTGLGLALDPALARENLASLARTAAECGTFVRIDMEDASTTDATLAAYRALRADGIENVGVVLQARLRRTLRDVGDLADLRPNVRLCKGIYLEPASIAYTDDRTVRRAFLAALEALLDLGSYVAVATHDGYLVGEAERIVTARGLARDAYEFQMLLGVRPELADALVARGHRLRVYVPYGRRWYEYSLRRLRENPRIASYVARDAVVRLGAGERRAAGP